jgi:hypothetical protein
VASGKAIEIITNNVVIDLNGHRIGGLTAGAGTHSWGIYADQRQNMTIRNGTLRGFYYGISLQDLSPYTISQGHIIEEIRMVKDNTVSVMNYGIYYETGSTGICMNNLASGCPNPIFGGTPAGSTNSSIP